MAPPPTSAFQQLSIFFNGPAVNYPAAVTIGTTKTADTAALFDVVEAWLEEDWKPEFSSDIGVQGLASKIGPSATGPTFTRALNIIGNVSTAATSANVSVLMTKQPENVSGRLGGRCFWPGLGKNSYEDNLLNGAVQLSLESAFNNLYDALQTLGNQPVIFRANSSDVTNCVGFNVQGLLATQRRRMRR